MLMNRYRQNAQMSGNYAVKSEIHARSAENLSKSFIVNG